MAGSQTLLLLIPRAGSEIQLPPLAENTPELLPFVQAEYT